MKFLPKSLALTVAVLAVFLLATTWVVVGHGVKHPSNSGTLAGVLLWCCGAFLVIAGIASLVISILSLLRTPRRIGVVGVATSMVALTIPWVIKHRIVDLVSLSERYDFQSADPDGLRLSARQLVETAGGAE